MDDELHRRARALGIEIEYRGADDALRRADADTLRFLVELLAQGQLAGRTRPQRGRPRLAYQPPFAERGEKAWLLAVQLYSLVTRANWGHGDFGDLLHLIELVAGCGGAGIGLNPLHALDESDPAEASPYAPTSRLFLNPLYIDVARLPGLTPDDLEKLKPRSRRRLIDYPAVAQAKFAALRLACGRLRAGADPLAWQDFLAFCAEHGELLEAYAVFCHLRTLLGRSWNDWPQAWLRPDKAAIAQHAERHAEEIQWRQFAQFAAHRQLMQCRDRAGALGMAIGLYLDLAVGVQPQSFDAWYDQESYLRGATIGAPPDPLNRGGQNWGLTAFNPAQLQCQAYAPFRAMLAATMRYAGAIRIDHVLGLNRLYLVPPGRDAVHGAYVRMPLEALLDQVALESRRHHCLVIGEDLGTVPAGLRKQLRDSGIWTYRVMMFEHDGRGFTDARDYPTKALVTFSTHDLPTFAGWLAGADIRLARRLGLRPGESLKTRQAKKRELRRVLKLKKRTAPRYADVAAFLARTPCQLVALSLEDLTDSPVQVNLPGTYREYPNWRHRLTFDDAASRKTAEQLSVLFPTR